MSTCEFLPLDPSLKNDEVVPATVRVTVTTPNATHYRVTQHVNDLGYGSWTPIPANPFDIPVWLPGYQSPGPATYAIELKYQDQSTEVLITPPITRGTPAPPPPPPPTPTQGYLMRALFQTGVPQFCQQYNDTSPRPGNNFIPFDWSRDDVNGGGYAWSTEHTRGIDVGETPDDIIAAHVYARWTTTPSVNLWDFSKPTTALVARLSSEHLDLKGGKLYFAVLCTFPDGRRGRYHLYGGSRALQVGEGAAFLETAFTFPSGGNSDWKCSYGADGVPIASMPAGPSFQVEALEIIIRDFTSPPTGQLRLKELAVIQ